MAYTEEQRNNFSDNHQIRYDRDHKHYYCYHCDKHLIKPLLHISTKEHENNKNNDDNDFRNQIKNEKDNIESNRDYLYWSTYY